MSDAQNQNTTESLLKQLLAQLNGTKGLDKLAAAYVRAWGEIGNVTRNATNPHFNSGYATLDATLDVIKPVFAKHELALFQVPGPMDGDKVSVIGMLMHSSGQTLNFTTQLPVGKATAQAAGSAFTYARRYQGQAVGGIAPVDDDGNAASEASAPSRKGKATKDSSASLLTAIEDAEDSDELKALRGAVRDAGDDAVTEAYLVKQKKLRSAA